VREEASRLAVISSTSISARYALFLAFDI